MRDSSPWTDFITDFRLKNIVLAYFPANCTSVIQQMDLGIINPFKIRYRTQVVSRWIQQIEYGDDGKEINVLDAINYMKTLHGDPLLLHPFRTVGVFFLMSLLTDDTTLYCSSELGDLHCSFDRFIKQLLECCSKNRININKKNTFSMVITNKRIKIPDYFMLGVIEIKCVDELYVTTLYY